MNTLIDLTKHFVKTYIKWTVILWLAFFVFGAVTANADPTVVKKSNSEICHAPDSSYYERTQNYTAFETLAECLASSDSARLPKNYQPKSEA